MNDNRKRHIFIIFFIAFIIRLAMNIVFQGLNSPPDPSMGPDHIDYDNYAQNIVKYGVFGIGPDEPKTSRPPGVSFILLPIYYMFGINYSIVRIFFSLLGALNCIVVFLIGRKLTSNNIVGMLGAYLLAFYPLHFYYSMHFFSEVPWALFISLAIWLSLVYDETPYFKYGILAGIFSAIAAYIRPHAFFYPLFNGLLYLGFYYKKGRKNIIRIILIPIISMFICILPWIVRNYRITNSLVLISTHGGQTFLGAHNEKIFKNKRAIGSWIPCSSIPEAQEILKINDEKERDKRAYNQAILFIKKHIKDLPNLELMKIYHLIKPFPDTPNKLFNVILGMGCMIILPFALFGIITNISNKKFIPLNSTIFLTLFITIIFYGDHRFRASVSPLLTVYASIGITHIKILNKGRFKKKL